MFNGYEYSDYGDENSLDDDFSNYESDLDSMSDEIYSSEYSDEDGFETDEADSYYSNYSDFSSM